MFFKQLKVTQAIKSKLGVIKKQNRQKNQFGIIVLADYYSIFIMNMALRGGGEMIVSFMIRLPADLRASIKDRAKAMGLSANAFPSPYGDFSF